MRLQGEESPAPITALAQSVLCQQRAANRQEASTDTPLVRITGNPSAAPGRIVEAPIERMSPTGSQ